MIGLIKDKFEKNSNVSNKKRKSNIPNLKKQYKMTIIFFTSCFAMLMFSSAFTGEAYEFEETEIGDIRSLTQNTPIELIKREWNPESGLLRIDLEIESSANNSTLSNIKYEATNRYVTNHTDTLDYEILRVNPRYLVMLIRDLPEGFDVLGVGINPSFIEPEIETDEGMEERAIQYYFYEESIEKNYDLVESDQEIYQNDWLTLQQDDLEKQIEDNNNQIRLSRIRIGNIEQSIRDTQQDEQYLTEDEYEAMLEEIANYESQITQEEQSIKRFNEEIATWEDRIVLYEEQKNQIMKDE